MQWQCPPRPEGLTAANAFRWGDGPPAQVVAALWSMYRAVTVVRVADTPSPSRRYRQNRRKRNGSLPPTVVRCRRLVLSSSFRAVFFLNNIVRRFYQYYFVAKSVWCAYIRYLSSRYYSIIFACLTKQRHTIIM